MPSPRRGGFRCRPPPPASAAQAALPLPTRPGLRHSRTPELPSRRTLPRSLSSTQCACVGSASVSPSRKLLSRVFNKLTKVNESSYIATEIAQLSCFQWLPYSNFRALYSSLLGVTCHIKTRCRRQRKKLDC